METIYIITFHSANNSLLAYKLLKNCRLKVVMIQTPCRLSAGCARSIEVKEKDIDTAVTTIKENSLSIQGVYKKFINPNTRRYDYVEVYY